MTEMLAKRLRRTAGHFKPLYPPFLITSDTHFGHANIVKYCNRPEDHEELMIKNWNQMVKPTDTILHLGDVFMGKDSFEKFKDNIAPRLNGNKYLILGNHDKAKVDWKLLGFDVIDPFSIPYQGWEFEFDHYPTEKTDKIYPGQNRIRIHGHIHNGSYNFGNGKGRSKIKPNHVNLSVEVTNYSPVHAIDIMDNVLKKAKPKQHYRNIGVKKNVNRIEPRYN